MIYPLDPARALGMSDPVLAGYLSDRAVWERSDEAEEVLAELLPVALLAVGEESVRTLLTVARSTVRAVAIGLDGPIPGSEVDPWLDEEEDDLPERVVVVFLDRD